MFWTVEQAADFLKKERYHINYLIGMGRLTAVKFGEEWRIASGDIENYEKQIPASTDCLKKIIESLDAILSARDVTACFNCTRPTVYHLLNMWRIPAWKDEDGQWCIARSDLLDYCLKRSNL